MKQPGIENLAPANSTGQLPPPAVTQKPVLRLEMAVLLVVAALFTVFQIFLVYSLTNKFNSDPATDFNIFLKFARSVLDGQSPYQPYQPIQGAFQGELRFIYLYWVIFFYLPFARLDYGLALNLWATINLLLLFGAVWLGWRAYLPKWRAYWLLPLYCLALAVCSNAIMNGHTTVIMLLGLTASAYLYRQGKFFAAGLPALVLLIKPQITFLAGMALLALVVYRAIKSKGLNRHYRDWPPLLKWLAGAVISTLIITAISLALEPDWPFRLAGAFNAQQINGQIQADGTYLEFYKAIFPSWLEFLTGWQQPWLALVSVPVMVGLLVWGGFRLWQWREDYPVFLGIGLALTLAVTTYSHIYDFPPLVLAIFIILGQVGRDWQAKKNRAALLRLGCLILLFVVQPLSPDYRWFYSQPFIITLLVLTISPEKRKPVKILQATTASLPKSKLNPAWAWSGGLFGLALVIRFVYALQLPFPPLDDPAYYIQGARSFFNGHPLDLAIIWSYHPAPVTVLHPGFDFWMPMTSFLIAASFLVLGDTALAAQLPGVVAGSILPVLTFWLARRVFASLGLERRSQFWLAGGAGLYIALNPLLAYQSAVPDSQMIYAALVAAAILVWTGKESPARSFGLGLLLGLAYLTRSHAVFLIAAWFIVMLVKLIRQPDSRRETLKLAGFSIVGLGLVAGPWLLRNWLVFGSFSSPAALESALIYNYATLFNYETPINFGSFANLGLDKIINARLIALYNAWVEVLGTMFVPTVILPAVGLFLLWRRKPGLVGRWLLYCLLLGLGLPLIFVAASSTGSFYHSSGSLAAFGAIGFIFLLYLAGEYYRKIRPTGVAFFPLLLRALLAVELIQFGVSTGTTIGSHQHDQAVYARLNDWLNANAVSGPIIADEPSTLNYATGRPALRLPSDESPEVVERLAKRYQATYIVITNYFGIYPTALESSSNKIFPLAYQDPQAEFEIYRVVVSGQ